MNRKALKFSCAVFILQILFILIFAFLAKYDVSADPKTADPDLLVNRYYPMFQDVHVMMFVGFGFLMTFMKLYGYTAVGVNMLVAAFVLQLALIVRGFIHVDLIGGDRFPITVSEMLSADFASATVLISFGAVLGKVSPLQLVIMAIIETILAQLNEYLGIYKLYTTDIGESMFVHVFGAYFGLAVTRVLYNEEAEENPKEGSIYHSDIFSMIGTIFLWLYWPSFNAGAAYGDEQHRAVINTYMSLSACCIVTFALSAILEKKGKFNMVHIQNATLAGGVAVGTTADMPLEPWGACLMGSVAALISVLGFKFLSPLMCRYLKIHDTCGVHNLHGMPGLLAGIAGGVMGALASYDKWGHSMCEIFPARAIETGDPCNEKLTTMRTALQQGGYQIAVLTITLAIAIGGGTLTGFILKIPILDTPKPEKFFEDDVNWTVADTVVHMVQNSSERNPDRKPDTTTRM